MITIIFGLLQLTDYLCSQKKKKMATREQIESMKIDENVFELVEDTELEYLVHFAAPFTGADKCIVPKGYDFCSS